MPKLKLSYFDMDGGRGIVARLAFSMGGIEFEDHRITFAQWPDAKAGLPFEAVPVLEIDGQAVAQSNGINRYAGKLAGLYPEDPLQAAFCDEAMDAVEDALVGLSASFRMTDDQERKAAREAYAEGPLSHYLRCLAARLQARGGEWFADGRLTIADLKVFSWVRHIRSGTLDYIPEDIVDRLAPELVAHCDRVAAIEGVKAYYQSRQ